MRIVSGIYKGRSIKSPEGLDTRPTTDRVRESIISSLISWSEGIDGLSVLDAFAGSGALGIECLSRGAKCCTFCDKSRKAFNVIKENLSSLQIDKKSSALLCVDVFKTGIPHNFAPYDVVLLDPPYKTNVKDVFKLIRSAMENKIVNIDAIIVYEYSSTSDQETNLTLDKMDFDVLSHKKFGSTSVDIITAR